MGNGGGSGSEAGRLIDLLHLDLYYICYSCARSQCASSENKMVGGGGVKGKISAATHATSNNVIYTESVVVPKPLKVRWGELSKPWKSGFRRMLFCICNGAIQCVCASPETLGSAQEVALRHAVTGICQTSVALSPSFSLSPSAASIHKTVFTPQSVTVAPVKCHYCVGKMCELHTHHQLMHIYSVERIIRSVPLNPVGFSRPSTVRTLRTWGTPTSLSVVR